ncbi:unnamed protein product [Prorocentrum cordatum]|uniref:peptidylprolyl isomerase n=1 Tax=Prorocentrum cordatum TaxID=2364126 RepID=A0ABN9Y855_9DINO|nr:unnamed protein product [Polarella glacialis]
MDRSRRPARDGVVQLKRGLQYKVLRPGAGSIRPGSEDICTVHYRGSTIDCEIQSGPEPCRGGFVFDDSWEKGRNVTFTPKSAGSFWALALPLMVRGALWELYVPQVLGFAGNDNPDRRPRGVGPNATLIFKVELLAIKGKDDAPLGEGRDPEAGPGVEL